MKRSSLFQQKRSNLIQLLLFSIHLAFLVSCGAVIDVPLSNLLSLLVQQRQPGVQLHQDGLSHKRVLQVVLEGLKGWSMHD
jgi:hypothetical protein